jgi:tyrosyl-tRNA synthetase
MLSPYEFWQYWRNTEDADVERFLKLYTPAARRDRPDRRRRRQRGQEALATAVTAIVHGREAAEQAAETARATFEAGALDLSLPTADVPKSELAAGLGIQAALVLAGLAASNGEARRSISSGAVKLNDQPVADERLALGSSDVLPEGVIKLTVGKKRHALLRPT